MNPDSPHPQILKFKDYAQAHKRFSIIPHGRSHSPEDLKTHLAESALFELSQMDRAIISARERMLDAQKGDGHWIFDLEADVTIPAEYVLLQVFLNREIGTDLQGKFASYIRRKQLEDGGWPIFTGGTADISASVKAYFALKFLGDNPEDPHMTKARQLIALYGGAAKVNVFTRITLALFGQIPWDTVPAMPPEIMRLPRWFFFNIYKVSYWSRTVKVPLLILWAKKPVHRLPPDKGVSELFLTQPRHVKHLDRINLLKPQKSLFVLLDRLLKRIEHWIPDALRKNSMISAEKWLGDHMKGEGGLGAIFPAMVNGVTALRALGYPDNHPAFQHGLKVLDDLILVRGDEAFCQPCVSPIWDTALSLLALLASGQSPESKAVTECVDWLFGKQILVPGDWCQQAPDLKPGGWAFQYENTYYPDLDDTAVVLMAIFLTGEAGKDKYRERIVRAVNWIIGMQSSDGGWGAFDIDNNHTVLNNIPFADHGALLDPSTSDVTARCMGMLSMLGYDRNFQPIKKAYKFLRRQQEKFGGWFGRWGVNYIYGTSSVLIALRQLGEDMNRPYIRKALNWLKTIQNDDNGWGESCSSYHYPDLAGKGPSTPSQTAWALLGLIAGKQENSFSVQRGIRYMIDTQSHTGEWLEPEFTGTGFPKVFYLRYHGYCRYFPLMALGMYMRSRSGTNPIQYRQPLKEMLNLEIRG